MTALCGGAASGPKPGFATQVILTATDLSNLLSNFLVSWALKYSSFVGPVVYDLSVLCTTDPPTLVVMTAADMFALAVPLADINASQAAVQKFYNFVKYWAWYQFCQCNTVATPAAPAAPAAPTGLPQVSPPIGSQPLGPCWDKQIVLYKATDTGVDISARLMPNIDGTGRAIMACPYFYMETTATDNRDGSNVGDWSGNIRFETTAGALVTNFGLSTTALLGTIVDHPFTSGASSCSAGAMKITSSTWNGGDTDSITLRMRLWNCPSSVGFPQAPCCPPDPVLAGQINQILQAVTLIQRQAVPFAYLASTVHAGLSGAGSFAVQGLLGVKIELTTIPGSLYQDGSTPPFVFSAGWVSMEDGNGFIDETRAHAASQVWLSRIASDATVIGYSFKPGVVATITELLREP